MTLRQVFTSMHREPELAHEASPRCAGTRRRYVDELFSLHGQTLVQSHCSGNPHGGSLAICGTAIAAYGTSLASGGSYGEVAAMAASTGREDGLHPAVGPRGTDSRPVRDFPAARLHLSRESLNPFNQGGAHVEVLDCGMCGCRDARSFRLLRYGPR